MPKAEASGQRACSPSRSKDASRSPEVSPATMAIDGLRRANGAAFSVMPSFRAPDQRAMPRVEAPRKSSIRSEEHTSELQSQSNLVCRLLLEKKKKKHKIH